jgi:hypothetical protein
MAAEVDMNAPGSLLDQLRLQYEAVHEASDVHGDVESFDAIDARLRKAFDGWNAQSPISTS